MKRSIPGTRITVLAMLAATAAATALAGCGTVRPVRSGRVGLFERLEREDRAVASKRGTTHPPRNVASEDVESGPGAIEIDGRAKDLGLHWPLKHVMVTSRFGQRGKEFHEGIDLRALRGTPVYAAQAGKVLYAGQSIRGYGKMVVLRHSFGQVATVYAHNSRLLVRVGQKVRRGQVIAISGSTGHVTGPHLHFEIREGTSAVDPLKFLPRGTGVAFKPIAEPPDSLVLTSR